ncbi:hypothetical protein SDJN02_18488, partial [Cucurbita argyrosperma subsp. argyrosperma]
MTNYGKALRRTPNLRCHRSCHETVIVYTRNRYRALSPRFLLVKSISMDEEVGAKRSKGHGSSATMWAIFKRSLRRESRKMKLLGSAFKWKRLTNLQISFMDNLLFKIVSMLEGVVLMNEHFELHLCWPWSWFLAVDGGRRNGRQYTRLPHFDRKTPWLYGLCGGWLGVLDDESPRSTQFRK